MTVIKLPITTSETTTITTTVTTVTVAVPKIRNGSDWFNDAYDIKEHFAEVQPFERPDEWIGKISNSFEFEILPTAGKSFIHSYKVTVCGVKDSEHYAIYEAMKQNFFAVVDNLPDENWDYAEQAEWHLLNVRLTFPICILHTPSATYHIPYGRCVEIPSIVIKESKVIRPDEWYRAVEFGNKFNGGTAYLIRGDVEIPSLELNEGSIFTHSGPGYIDGYGCGFKGGSIIFTE